MLVRPQTAPLTAVLPQLRADLHDILRAAVAGIEPGHLVRSALARGILAALPSESISLVAAGKAAWPMACAFDVPVSEGVVAGPRVGPLQLPEPLEWLDAAHPSPDGASEAAGHRALAIAAARGQQGSLVVLLSGGASSMMAAPAPGLSLADKIVTARELMNAGVAIADLNCVRKHLSAVKGGRLAALARRTITLAISDVHGPVADDPAVIGSGPTVADPTTCADALAIVRSVRVKGIPERVVAHLEAKADETPKPGDPRLAQTVYEVIASRRLAMEGAARAARALGYTVYTLEEATTGEAREAGVGFVAKAVRLAGGSAGHGAAPSARVCVIASGETTVHVRGSGRGGRNQEFVLAAVPLLASLDARHQTSVLASAGTDGIDGPTDAAGALADTTSSARAGRAGVDWRAALESNGAYDFFEPLGDLIRWGPTGTNVGDIHVMLLA